MTQQPQEPQDHFEFQLEETTAETLVAFLRQHCPSPPPPAALLENQIMELVQATTLTPESPPRRLWRWTRWRTTTGLVAGVLLAVGIAQRLLGPPVPSAAGFANLEQFWESNWQGIIAAPEAESLTAQADWLILSSSGDVGQENQ